MGLIREYKGKQEMEGVEKVGGIRAHVLQIGRTSLEPTSFFNMGLSRPLFGFIFFTWCIGTIIIGL